MVILSTEEVCIITQYSKRCVSKDRQHFIMRRKGGEVSQNMKDQIEGDTKGNNNLLHKQMAK